ncbi:hypothetical protein V2J09_018058 [Rumex salicifolius]
MALSFLKSNASEIQRTLSGRSQKWMRSSSKKMMVKSVTITWIILSPKSLPHLQEHNTTLTHELRIFVGTWNVGGRSPAHTLAGDLEEWLNLKSAVDIYFSRSCAIKHKDSNGLDDHSETSK